MHSLRGLTNYKITCKKCQQSTIVGIINEQQLVWNKTITIISGRKRLDGQWGWQCLCGNNDLLTVQENKNITNKQNPDHKEIKQILENLKPDKPKFAMTII